MTTRDQLLERLLACESAKDADMLCRALTELMEEGSLFPEPRQGSGPIHYGLCGYQAQDERTGMTASRVAELLQAPGGKFEARDNPPHAPPPQWKAGASPKDRQPTRRSSPGPQEPQRVAHAPLTDTAIALAVRYSWQRRFEPPPPKPYEPMRPEEAEAYAAGRG